MTSRTLSLWSLMWIPLAMAMGVLAMTGVFIAVRLGGGVQGDPQVARVLTIAVVALAFGVVPVYLVLRRVFLARVQEQRVQALELLAQDQAPPPLITLTILSTALIEGVGIFGGVTVLLGASWFMLAVPGLAVALILLQLPTRARLDALARG